MSRHHKAYALLLLTTLLWGGNSIAGKLAVGQISPMLLVFLRWVLAVLILLPFAGGKLRDDWPLAKRHLPLLVALDQAGPQPNTTSALLVLLKDGGAESAVAAQLLGRIHAKEAVDPLMKLLDEPTAVGRREALLALGEIGDPKAAEVIARDLNNESSDVRAAAADALRMVGAPAKDATALDALKSDYYRRVRESAEAALGKSGGAPEAKRQE